MYRVFRSKHYETNLGKLDASERQRVMKFEQALKQQPFSGKPLGYAFLREEKFDGKRLLLLVYAEQQCVFLVTLMDKKAQQQEIDWTKNHLELYR
ncbi:MAG TPA: hypothetical protein VKQ08_05160 [Cyclobacteriaceae bacterium]|nr:hypothetical protein [Cyclobacteriaceae bacterium]